MNTNQDQEKIYYKVVTPHLKSAIINDNYTTFGINRKYCVQYKLREFVYPILKNSKLMVFETKTNTENFLFFAPKKYYIFTCHILNPSKDYYTVSPYTHYDFQTYWSHNMKKNECYNLDHVNDAPKGTIFCDAVKLLERIEL